jgi:hypothetical protein
MDNKGNWKEGYAKCLKAGNNYSIINLETQSIKYIKINNKKNHTLYS